MLSSYRPGRRLIRCLILIVTLSCPVVSLGATQVGVAVITDGAQYQLREVETVFRQELVALVGSEFEINFKNLPADWSANSVESALQAAYNDPTVDMVLVLGFAGNQLAVSRPEFPKPTFLPLVFNPELLAAPSENTGSGRRNLNYLSDRSSFQADLATFKRVMPFDHAVLLTDTVIIDSIPNGAERVRQEGAGTRFSFVGHDGVDNDLLKRIPVDANAVLLGGLPRLQPELFEALLRALAERGLPVFSLYGESDVVRGALASDAVQTDFQRLARRTAINMQAVMLGEPAEAQSILYEGKRQLTINMAVARTIGLSPRFDVLSEAELVNALVETSGEPLTLASVARDALANNLDLAVSEFDVRIGEQSVAGARSNLLPQVNVGASYSARRDEELARSPGFPQRATAGNVTLNQPIFVESARSGFEQEQYLQESRIAALESARLDSVQIAANAYLQALRAQNQLKIQQENLALTKSNLELARDRVRAGSASNADVYRWEASLATARANVLLSLSAQQQAYDELNRILNRPIGNVPNLAVPARSEPFAMTATEFDTLINNPRRFGWFVEYSIEQSLNLAPELRQLQLQIDAASRDVIARERSFWAPDVTVQAQYTDNLNASGLGSGSVLDELNDWSVSLNASWPLFDSGARRSQLSRASLQEKQLTTQFAATAQRIEQNVRAAILAAQASYANLDLSESGAVASRKNLELVSDAYRAGTVSIIDLLDAQSQSLQADLTADNAVHDFLLDIIAVQRATSTFDFLLPATLQIERSLELMQFIADKEAQLVAPGATP